ncbi:MAG: hypothetical protein HRU09_18820, partial [Oligoflexales bacterium]|nr:hypothetical protein [Oligoflexales bacterium]
FEFEREAVNESSIFNYGFIISITYDSVTYDQDIKPIIKRHCIFCHNGLVPARSNLGQYKVAKQLGEVMLAYMEGNGPVVMPPSGRLSDDKVDLVRQWVESG